MRSVTIVLGTAGLAFFPTAVTAFPVTWEFTGQLTSVRDLDGSLEGIFSVGMPFSGAYTFESTTPDSVPDNPGFARYGEAVLHISGEVGEIPFVGPGNFGSAILVSDASPAVDFDSYAVGVLDVSTGSLSDRSV